MNLNKYDISLLSEKYYFVAVVVVGGGGGGNYSYMIQIDVTFFFYLKSYLSLSLGIKLDRN